MVTAVPMAYIGMYHCKETAMEALKDSMHLEVERRARHAERPGFSHRGNTDFAEPEGALALSQQCAGHVLCA